MKVISFSTEDLSGGNPSAVMRFAGQVADACADALTDDDVSCLYADGTPVALIVPLPPEED